MEKDGLDHKTVTLLKRSGEQQGGLIPVVKDQYGNIISGRHRKAANPNWRETTVEVKDDLDRLLKIIHYNVQRKPTQKETAETIVKIAAILEKRGIPLRDIGGNISALVPYSDRYIRMLLPEKYKHEEFSNIDFSPQLYNVWNFGECDDKFGTDGYSGRIPGQIVQNLLYYFTDENELIVDPMAGSGTTFDVCQLMKRRCLCYDLNPSRTEIKQHDIKNGFPDETVGCDLIFLDPPYYNMVYEELFNTIDEFYAFIQKLAEASFKTVKTNGYVAFLMQDMTEKGNYCLSGESYRIFREVGLKTIAHISCPLSTQQFLPQQVESAKKERRIMGRNRDLYVFRKQ